MKHKLFLILWILGTVYREINSTKSTRNVTDRRVAVDSCEGATRRRIGDDTQANVYYICNKNRKGAWVRYAFKCPKGAVFIQELEKCDRHELSPILTSTSISVTSYKYSTPKPYIISSMAESLKEIQEFIRKNNLSTRTTTTTTTTERPRTTTPREKLEQLYFSDFFMLPLLNTAKPVNYDANLNFLSSTTPESNLEATKINSLSSVQMSTAKSTAKPEVTTASPTTAVPLSKQDELVVRDFIMKFANPLTPFTGGDNYILPQSLLSFDSKKGRIPPLRSTKPKSKIKIKLPVANPTNVFSVQLLERFGVKLIPEDQFFFKRKPVLQNFTSTVYSSPEDTSIYEPPLILENPVNLPNHLKPLPLPPIWFGEVQARDTNEKVSFQSNFSDPVSKVSRKPRI